MRPAIVHPALAGALSLGVAGEVRAQDDVQDEVSEEVVVEGRAAPEVAAGTTAVVVADVARPGDGLEDVLATVPGVRIRRLGGLGAFAGISLRGTGFRQTLVRLDGVPLNPDGVEAVDLSRWPLAGLSRVDVTRGRPAATVGAAPIGGVVDLWTTPEASLQGEGAIGAFGSVRGSFAASGGQGNVDGLLSADLMQTAGEFPYVDDGGTRYDPEDDVVIGRSDNQRTQGAVLARGRVGDARRRLSLLASGAHRREGLPGPIGLSWSGVSLRTDRMLVSLSGEGVVGAGRTSVTVWTRWRGEVLDDPLGALGSGARTQRDAYTTVGGRWTGQGALHPLVSLRGSVQARREGFVRRLDDVPGRQQEARWGLGAALDLPITPLHGALEVVPGVDVRALWPEASLRDGVVAAMPGIVVRGTTGPVSLWASGTGAFRPPDLTELYGNRGALVGNPDLRPERAWKAEAGLRASGTGSLGWQVEAAAFATWATDAIGWLQNTQRTQVAVNFGRTRTVGGELGLGLSWRSLVGLQASFTGLDARQTTDDPTRQGLPVPFTALVRTWVRAWTAPGWGWRFGIDVDQTSAVPVDPQGVTRMPPRALLGAFASWDIPDSPFSVSVDLRNLLDVRTGLVDRDPLGPDDTRVPSPITDLVGYPLPGRTWWLGVRFTPPLRGGPT